MECFKNIGAFVLIPISSGSSFGVKIFRSIRDIDIFFDNFNNEISTYKKHDNLMIEPYVKGRELTVGLLDNVALAIVEIFPLGSIFLIW